MGSIHISGYYPFIFVMGPKVCPFESTNKEVEFLFRVKRRMLSSGEIAQEKTQKTRAKMDDCYGIVWDCLIASNIDEKGCKEVKEF